MRKICYAVILTIVMVMLTSCGAAGETAEKETEATIGTEAKTDTETRIETEGQISGGWELYENQAAVLPEEVQAAFDKAVEKFTGSQLTPVAYIARQIVAGTNYMILCQATPMVENPVSSYKMVIIYEDLDGNAEISKISDLDPADFNR